MSNSALSILNTNNSHDSLSEFNKESCELNNDVLDQFDEIDFIEFDDQMND